MIPTKNFKPNEFVCPCCGKEVMDQGFVDLLQKARDIAGIPFSINSGYRCVEHNENVGGEKTSSHLIGYAVDIAAGTSRKRFLIINSLLKVGLTRIGIKPAFIHVDNDYKPSGVIWL